MNAAIEAMLARYHCQKRQDYENALKEILQEIALLGLWRAKFFEHAAFYGGTALRILYGLDRFSEDMDFSLLRRDSAFSLEDYTAAVRDEMASFGFDVRVQVKVKSEESTIQSAFIKAETKKNLIEIRVPSVLAASIHPERTLKIKIEVDADPPGGFETQARPLLQPIPFHVVVFQISDLFAGKAHALLCRAWQSRTKGRDWYDLVWYVGRDTPVRLTHLRERLIQSKRWPQGQPLGHSDLVRLLLEKIEEIDFDRAKLDVLPFLKDPASVEIWSKNFFRTLVSSRLKSV